jgi:hypothetical protein
MLLFKYLRVLTLDGDYDDLTIDLSTINQLFQLRYLRVVAFGGSIVLPCSLKGLVYLETLDLYGSSLENRFPSDIVHLPRLSYLPLPRGAPAIQGVQNMKSLRTLRGFYLDENSVKDIRGLGDEGMTNGPPIFAYLVFGPERVSHEGHSRPIKAVVWCGPGAILGAQARF